MFELCFVRFMLRQDVQSRKGLPIGPVVYTGIGQYTGVVLYRTLMGKLLRVPRTAFTFTTIITSSLMHLLRVSKRHSARTLRGLLLPYV